MTVPTYTPDAFHVPRRVAVPDERVPEAANPVPLAFQVMADAGITKMPETWDELKEACVTLKEAGVNPISLGSMNRWPAQFWFDYMVSYTAGAEYRQKLMAGEAKYTDPEVVTAMETWKELTDLGCFAPDSNAYDWTEAADMVANGTAAMNLMGTFITG